MYKINNENIEENKLEVISVYLMGAIDLYIKIFLGALGYKVIINTIYF